MSIHRALSALLSYPEDEMIAALPEISAALAAQPGAQARLAPLFAWLMENSLVKVQENYVATFDRSRQLSLYLFEHIHGESRARGEALLDLLHEYQRHGFEPDDRAGSPREMPDYLPLFLEFLGQLPPDEAGALLADAVDVIALLQMRLAERGSPYAPLLAVLVGMSPRRPQPMTDAPAREMDALLETVGPGADGSEPLLRPDNGMVRPIHIHRRPGC